MPEGLGEEVLRGGDDAEDEAVQREDDVVEGDGGGEAGVAGGVLGADGGGVVEGGVGGEVSGEACFLSATAYCTVGEGRRTEDVEEGEVDGRARGGGAAPVEQGLRVEGGAPAEEVDPAEEAREEG